MVTGPKAYGQPAIYENTHIITKRGVSSGTITIHPENIPESVMMDFQVEYHQFKERFMEKHSRVFPRDEEEGEEPVAAPPAPDPAPPATPPAPAPDPAPRENKDNGAGKMGECTSRREWSETEKEIVRKAKDKDDAVKAYREMFPESERSDYAIRQRFNILTKQKDNGSNSPGDELQEKPGGKSTTGELKRETPLENKEEPAAAPGPAIPEDGIIVGSRVKQVKGKDRAYGIGTVQGAGVDTLRVKFVSSIKVLPRDHFELARVEKKEAEGVKA